MKIWIDACTGKHVRYAKAISKRLEKLGHKTVLTTRKHPDTILMAKRLGLNFEIVGDYNPSSLSSRFAESLIRQICFSEKFRNDKPNLLITFQSVDACRVAFGLGVPIISTADTPHAEKVNRLTVPLVDVLITSSAIPEKIYKRYGATKIVTFNGVDELAWIKDHELLLELFKVDVVVRESEFKASYNLGKQINNGTALFLTQLGEVLFLSRKYSSDDKSYMVSKNRTYPFEHYGIDLLNIMKHSGITISVGGTISRESALLGTPSIAFGDFAVNQFLFERGFPLFIVKNNEEMLKIGMKYIHKKIDVSSLIGKLENPLDIIEKEVERFEVT